MEDDRIIALYNERNELAIAETSQKIRAILRQHRGKYSMRQPSRGGMCQRYMAERLECHSADVSEKTAGVLGQNHAQPCLRPISQKSVGQARRRSDRLDSDGTGRMCFR